MANKAGGLRLDLLDKMFKRLDDIHEKLIKINKTLDEFEKNGPSKKLGKSYEQLNSSLNKLSTTIKKLDSGKSFLKFATTLKKSINILADLNVTKAASNITAIVDTFKKAGGGGRKGVASFASLFVGFKLILSSLMTKR